MAQFTAPLYSLNSGVVSRYSGARVDLAKMKVAAETQQNLMPRVLGPATFRPGFEYKTRTYNDVDCKLVPFVFNADTKALVEVSSTVARFIVDGVPVTRPTVTAALTNATLPYIIDVADHTPLGAANRDPALALGFNTWNGPAGESAAATMEPRR